MKEIEHKISHTRIPLVAGTVIAVRRRPWLAYLLIAIALLGIVWLWSQQKKGRHVNSTQYQQLHQLEKRLQTLQAQQQKTQDDLTQRNRQMDEIEAHLARWDEALNIGQRQVWIINEVGYFLRLAQQHLLLTRDTQGALTLLDVSDQLLAGQTDSRFLALRQALAHDKLALAGTGQDSTGIYIRLSTLSDHLSTLSLPIAATRAELASTPNDATLPTTSQWETSLKKLRQFVTIRHHDQALKPLLNDNELALVKESLRLDIAQAQLALLRNDPVIYQNSLRAAEKRILQFFPLLAANEKQTLQQEFLALLAVDIKAAPPALTASIKALETLAVTISPATSAPPPAQKMTPVITPTGAQP